MSAEGRLLRLLPNADAGYHENNLARAAIWWLAPDLQMPIWEALEMTGFTARVSGIPVDLGPLALSDSLVLVAIETMWAEQGSEARAANWIPYSLTEIWHRLGHDYDPSGLETERLRRSLLRLTYAKIEREWFDVSLGEEVHQVRGIIADADFIKKGKPGQFGRAMRGWVSLSPELHRQLAARQVAYALDLPTLLDLPSPLAQRLYLFLSADQMRPFGEGRDLVAYTYPLGRALYGTLGVTDSNTRRIRTKIQAAGEDIREREPLYLRIEVEAQARRRHEWKLSVVRRRGRSLAPALRRQHAEELTKAAVRATLPSPIETAHFSAALQSEPAAARVSAADEAADRARHDSATRDPRVARAFGRWMHEAQKGHSHEMAWREYRRDLIEWIAAGEQDEAPREPDLD